MSSATPAADSVVKEKSDDSISTNSDCAEGRLQQDQLRNVHFENVLAAEDAQQVIVSTMQKGVFGRNLTVKAKGNQLLGQMADSSVHQLSKDRANVLLGAKECPKESREAVSFSRVHGAGHTLTKK